ncbi:MAG: hypothetical protein Q9O74_11290 [Planctomycetota bacterium]|nr:hypothetical protein [Planctomycetota bacterium]
MASAAVMLIGLAFGAGLVPTASGQAESQAAEGVVSPEEYTARSIARVALLDLRSRVHPTPDDYVVTGKLLDVARVFAPQDAELLRGRIRAAWSAGQQEALGSLTRELVRLDPSDTVAQLRLASSRVRSVQTVEGRLAMYDRLIGSAGAAIDPSVRSRLALDAALLCRENNNFAGFADRLAMALQLDSTNKDAASLAWQMFGPMMETPGERFELLLNLLMADPTDPNVHRSIATELALAGGFEQAQRFHNMALTLFTQADSAVADQLVLESAVLRWQIEGPGVVVETLNNQLGIMRQQAVMRIQQFQEARMPTESLPQPHEIMLAPQYNQMRLVAALMAEDQETIQACLVDMQSAYEAMVETFQQRAGLSTEEELQRGGVQLWQSLSQQLIAVAWANAQDDSFATWAEQAAISFPRGGGPTKVLEAWTELRMGEPAAAVGLFEALDASSPLNRVGLGIAMQEAGRADDAIEVFTQLARDLPLSLSGVWARAQVRDATGNDPLATPTREAMVALASDVPGWVDRMVSDARLFMAISVELNDTSIGPTDQTVLTIKLTNLAPIPLGVGGDRPINSRLMLSPRLQAGMLEEYARASAEVVELDRRLRLMPGETLVAEIWPDQGMTGWLAEVSATEAVRQMWRVLQGYRLDSEGVPEVGVLCLETETDRLVRAPLPLARATGLELADALESAGLFQLVDVLAAVRARVLAPAASEYSLTDDEVRRLASIAASRYESQPQLGRAMMLAVLPTRSAVPAMEAFDRVAMQELDPVLVPLVLGTRVVTADDPTLAALLDSEADGLGDFARALQTRLASRQVTYSRLPASVLGPILPPAEKAAAGSGR